MYSNEGQGPRRRPAPAPAPRGGRGGSGLSPSTAVPGGTSTRVPTPAAPVPTGTPTGTTGPAPVAAAPVQVSHGFVNQQVAQAGQLIHLVPPALVPLMPHALGTSLHTGIPITQVLTSLAGGKLSLGGRQLPALAPSSAVGRARQALETAAKGGRIPAALLGGKGGGGGPSTQQITRQAVQQVAATIPKDLRGNIAGTNLNFRQFIPTLLSAAKANKVPASILMAQIQAESGFGTAPNTFSGSSAGAQGVTQFEPATAQEYGVNLSPTAAGIKSQIAGQAKLMGKNLRSYGLVGALQSYNSGRPGVEAPGYSSGIISAARSTYGAADQAAKVLAGGGGRLPGGGGGGPYVSPFKKSQSYTQSRTDEGVDYTGTGAIVSPGRARYLGVGQGPGWASGGGGGSGYGVVEKLLRGPKKGKSIFLYEGIAPAGKPLSKGDVIKKGQTIAAFTPGSIEMGYSDRSGAPLAQPTYNEGDVTAQGTAYQRFLHKLGAASAPGASGVSGTGSGVTVSGTRAYTGAPYASGTSATAAAATGAPPSVTNPAARSAAQQNKPTPPALVQLTPPNASGVPFPAALAALFGGVLPSNSGGGATGPASGMSTPQLATLLATIASQPGGSTSSPLAALLGRRTPTYSR